jgi:hypothetical protein
MNKCIIFSVFLIFVCYSCSLKNKTSDNDNVCYLEDKSELLSPKDLFSNVTFLPLETNDDFLIGRINKIVKTDSLYYILDKREKSIFVYSSNGMALHKIYRQGSGPDEYIDMLDFTVTKDDIVLLCSPGKLIFIDKETLKVSKNEYKIDKTYYKKIELWNDQILLCNYYAGEVDMFNIENRSRENIFKWKPLQGYIPNDLAFYKCNDQLFFMANGDDQIYRVEADFTFSPILKFDYAKKESAIKFYSNREMGPLTNPMEISQYPLVDVENIFYHNNEIGFIYTFVGIFRISFVNSSGVRIFKYLSVPAYSSPTIDGHQLISWKYSYQLENVDFNGLPVRNKDYLNSIDPDDPLLLIYEFKNSSTI